MLYIKSTAGEAGTETVGELPTTFTKPQTTLALTNTVAGSSSESGPAPSSETAETSSNAANVTQDSTTLFATNSPESVINITVTSFSNTNSTDTSTTSTSVVTSTATTTTPV
jgi:hypothetical protein